MSRPHLPLWVSQLVAVIVAGLGLGFGMARFWRADSYLPAQKMPAPTVFRSAERPAAQARGAQPDPAAAGQAVTRRALLIGVTKYDNLPRDRHLGGPSHDAHLMSRLLRERYQFPAEGIVTLTEDEGSPARRPTRANIEREFHNLAKDAREGDQVVILLAGHGSQEPENPPDPIHPEPDGLNEIFLPADVSQWKATPGHVPNAIIDDDLGVWLRAITAKRAYVWAIFDCCHSGTMTRGTEVVRELPPELLVPREELAKARERAAQRQEGQEKTRGGPSTEPPSFVPREASDYLVAVYACRPTEVTPESLQPPESPHATYHGLLTYSLVHVLTESADSKTPPSYRDLVRRLQIQYAARPQGSPTPLVEGKGQDRIVLGTEEVKRSPLLLTHDQDGYKLNAGDLYGLTQGSILAVDSSSVTGPDGKPTLLGYVQVLATRPFDSTAEPCAYEGSALVKDLPSFSTCRVVLIDCALQRFKIAIVAPKGLEAPRLQVQRALLPLADAKTGLVELVADPAAAHWVLRVEQGKLELVEACGNRAPFALPAPNSPTLSGALRQSIEKIYRARNLVAVSSRFESERNRGTPAVDIELQVLRHKNQSHKGEVLTAPAGGWVFRPGDLISFGVRNRTESLRLDVTLLVIGSDFEIQPFYPQRGDLGHILEPGQTLQTPAPWGEISTDPPFGPENLVVIAVPANNPPADFTALAQGGLPLARAADGGGSLRSPLGQLLESAMFQSASRGRMNRSVAQQHGMRILNWRTEPR
jgi:uncharacterized caspase-like protein